MFVFAALVFAEELTNPSLVWLALKALVAFCLVSSSVYVFNDLADMAKDRHHPEKKHRPLASGKLSVRLAMVGGLVCLGMGIIGGLVFINSAFVMVLLAYLIVNILYSLGLKRVVIVDLLLVAVGFVLRAIAGALAISVAISPWLLSATFFLALFLILGKRRHELLNLGDDGAKHRSVLGDYSQTMLDAMLLMVTTTTIVMYSLYTMAPQTIEHFNTNLLIYTVIFVVYGIFRAFYLIYQKNQGGAPTEMLLTDRPLQLNLLLWLIIVLAIIYR